MTLESRLLELVQAIGLDIKALVSRSVADAVLTDQAHALTAYPMDGGSPDSAYNNTDGGAPDSLAGAPLDGGFSAATHAAIADAGAY